MVVFIFIAVMVLAAFVFPMTFVAMLVGLVVFQALLIMVSAHFVMGRVAFLHVFKAAILSVIFTAIGLIAAVQMMTGGLNPIFSSILGFLAILFASGAACSIALGSTFSAGASISVISAILGTFVIKLLNLL